VIIRAGGGTRGAANYKRKIEEKKEMHLGVGRPKKEEGVLMKHNNGLLILSKNKEEGKKQDLEHIQAR